MHSGHPEKFAVLLIVASVRMCLGEINIERWSWSLIVRALRTLEDFISHRARQSIKSIQFIPSSPDPETNLNSIVSIVSPSKMENFGRNLHSHVSHFLFSAVNHSLLLSSATYYQICTMKSSSSSASHTRHSFRFYVTLATNTSSTNRWSEKKIEVWSYSVNTHTLLVRIADDNVCTSGEEKRRHLEPVDRVWEDTLIHIC